MAQHKPATAVTIAPLAEPTVFEQTVRKLWLPFALVAVAVSGWLVFRMTQDREAQASRARAWERLLASTTMGRLPDPRIPTAAPAQMAAAADAAKGSIAGPWGRFLEFQAFLKARDYAGAEAALAKLRAEAPDHLLVRESFELGSDVAAAGPRTLADHMEGALRKLRDWEAGTPGLFSNPPPPQDAPKVRLKTEKGDILVALYASEAPKHAENFLKLCRDGYYIGTKFHRIGARFMIQGGDPNSREGAPETWGQGGPDSTIEPEKNQLYHFSGVLSAAKKPGERESSGSQFFIAVEPIHHLDGQHVVFGAVLEGMDVVRQIAGAEISPGTGDRPASPVALAATEVL